MFHVSRSKFDGPSPIKLYFECSFALMQKNQKIKAVNLRLTVTKSYHPLATQIAFARPPRRAENRRQRVFALLFVLKQKVTQNSML
jgi:hypothetical protein